MVAFFLVVVGLVIGTRHVVVVDHECRSVLLFLLRLDGSRYVPGRAKAIGNWRAYASLPRATSIALWRRY
jgi:hypothetical protein